MELRQTFEPLAGSIQRFSSLKKVCLIAHVAWKPDDA
jgi:hypothetical protein